MMLLDRRSTLLLVVDVQERLAPVIDHFDAVEQNIIRLVRGAAILSVPVMHTEQYPQGLGATVSSVALALAEGGAGEPVQKMRFSAAQETAIRDRIRNHGITDVVIAGIETHVCVWQTAAELHSSGVRVSVAADAVGSRSPSNRELALRRMEAAGIAVTSTEMALFELTGVSGTDQFRAISRLVR